MKAKDAILITTRLRPEDFHGGRLMKTRTRVTGLIQTIRSLGLNPIVVLGPAGDDVLRACPDLEDSDLAFDPNFDGGLFSGIHAGVHAATGAAFILPVDTDPTTESVWRALDQAAWALKPGDEVHVLQTVNRTDGDNRPEFPQLVTRAGLKLLRTLPPDGAWESNDHIRFRLLHAESESKTALAT